MFQLLGKLRSRRPGYGADGDQAGSRTVHPKDRSGSPATAEFEIQLIRDSQLFDENWYREKYAIAGEPIDHYVRDGANRGFAPHPLFDVNFYLKRVGALGGSALTPLGHYINKSAEVQDTPQPLFDPAWYAECHPEAAKRDGILFRDYIKIGGPTGLSPHPLFDVEWYIRQVPTLAQSGLNALTHFVELGAAQGLTPNPFFDTKWYREKHLPFVGESNPLSHYIAEGAHRRLSPSPLVDWELYRSAFDAPDDDLTALIRLVTQDRHEYLQKLRDLGERPPRRDPHPKIVPARPRQTALPPSLSISADPANIMLASIARAKRIVEIGYQDNKATLVRAVLGFACGALDYRVLQRDLPARLRDELLSQLEEQGIFRRSADLTEADDEWLPYWKDGRGDFDPVINGSVFERDIRNKLGDVDVVVALSGLFHEREPLGFLRRLATLTQEYLIIYTTITSRFERLFGNEIIEFADDDMWSANTLSLSQAIALQSYWRERGVTLPQFELFQSGLPWEHALNGGGWLWFFGEQAVARLIGRAGLEIVNSESVWEDRGRVFLVRRKENQI